MTSEMKTVVWTTVTFLLITTMEMGASWEDLPAPRAETTDSPEYSFMVAIVQTVDGVSTVFTAGSLIDETHVLTYGPINNALVDYILGGITVEAWIGVSDLDNFNGPKIPLKADMFFNHPNVSDPGNGVAIIELPTPVSLQPICVGTGDYSNGGKVNYIGFGAIGCSTKPVRKLRARTGTIVDVETCQIRFNSSVKKPPPPAMFWSTICVDLEDDKGMRSNFGFGDGGGPLFTKGSEEYIQIGTIQWRAFYESNNCPFFSAPTAFTLIGKFRSFIEERASSAKFCDDSLL